MNIRASKSLKGFSREVCCPLQYLEELASLGDRLYSPYSKRSKSGKPRVIDNPKDILKAVQRTLNAYLVRVVAFAPPAFGGIRGRSAKSNAQKHCKSKKVLRIDVRNFYPSISDRLIFNTLVREYGFGRSVASLLTRLTTNRRHLAVGAPTSSTIANMVLGRADERLQEAAANRELVYTRYIDDFVISGACPESLAEAVIAELGRLNLRVARQKFRVMPASSAQVVTGFGVNSREVSIPRAKREAIRSAIHQLADANDRSKAIESIRGRINFAATANVGSARKLKRDLEERAVELGIPLDTPAPAHVDSLPAVTRRKHHPPKPARLRAG